MNDSEPLDTENEDNEETSHGIKEVVRYFQNVHNKFYNN